ncbi:MAG: hypothetical protein ABR985_11380 [Methanotrichaceae archaeon]|jgi:hypothetical protein
MPRCKRAYRRHKPRLLSDLEVNLLKKLCHRYGSEDDFDWEGNVDRNLSYEENRSNLISLFGFSNISESQYESTYDDYAEMAEAFNAESLARYKAEEAERPEIEMQPAIQQTVEPDTPVPVIQVTRVYLPTASGEWVPVYISVPSKNVIEIPVSAQPSGHYRKN